MGSYMKVFNQEDVYKVFPSPREAWVVSYGVQPGQYFNAHVFPAPIEVWVGSYERRSKMSLISFLFPAPREAWVVSYWVVFLLKLAMKNCFRPLARLG